MVPLTKMDPKLIGFYWVNKNDHGLEKLLPQIQTHTQIHNKIKRTKETIPVGDFRHVLPARHI